jgi:site-specific recombinase XerD
MMLFKELLEYSAVKNNIIRDISKRKHIVEPRRALTEEERKIIKEEMPKVNYRFWLFINIFFHSGMRTTEFIRMKIKDIDLQKQTLKVLSKKGKNYRITYRPIKNNAVKFFDEYLSGCTYNGTS